MSGGCFLSSCRADVKGVGIPNLLSWQTAARGEQTCFQQPNTLLRPGCDLAVRALKTDECSVTLVFFRVKGHAANSTSVLSVSGLKAEVKRLIHSEHEQLSNSELDYTSGVVFNSFYFPSLLLMTLFRSTHLRSDDEEILHPASHMSEQTERDYSVVM